MENPKTPKEQDYNCTCPKCKAHLNIEISLTVATLIKKVTIAKEE